MIHLVYDQQFLISYIVIDTELAGGGFNMVVGNGSRTHGTCSIKTKVVLTCNSSAVWSNNDLTKLLSYRHENDNPCEVKTMSLIDFT